jgi:MoaA/NifB/PqqE/SkfB family radical SAM enzyme
VYLTNETIEELHVETTNKCNAACPMCDRNIFGGIDKPGKGFSEWSLEDIDSVFTGLPNLKFVYFCGTHGDPLASKHIFEAIHAVKKLGARIEMFTNGSLKTQNWWHKLISILDERDRITFGVDGLETNHLYRQNTDINKIVSHMKIATASKVKVRWDFLAFKHNEHELENCKKFAKEIGVTNFRVRRTARFDLYSPWPVINQNDKLTHYLEIPSDPELIHPSLKDLQSLQNKKINMTNTSDREIIIQRMKNRKTNYMLDSDPIVDNNNWKINCMYKEAKKIYVNSRLDVFPCSYISDSNETFKALTPQELKYPEGELNLKTKTWKEVLDHKFYAKDLVESFTNNNIIPRCIRTCGVVERIYQQNLRIEE